jgi:hypothetical protein
VEEEVCVEPWLDSSEELSVDVARGYGHPQVLSEQVLLQYAFTCNACPRASMTLAVHQAAVLSETQLWHQSKLHSMPQASDTV